MSVRKTVECGRVCKCSPDLQLMGEAINLFIITQIDWIQAFGPLMIIIYVFPSSLWHLNFTVCGFTSRYCLTNTTTTQTLQTLLFSVEALERRKHILTFFLLT